MPTSWWPLKISQWITKVIRTWMSSENIMIIHHYIQTSDRKTLPSRPMLLASGYTQNEQCWAHAWWGSRCFLTISAGRNYENPVVRPFRWRFCPHGGFPSCGDDVCTCGKGYFNPQRGCYFPQRYTFLATDSIPPVSVTFLPIEIMFTPAVMTFPPSPATFSQSKWNPTVAFVVMVTLYRQ